MTRMVLLLGLQGLLLLSSRVYSSSPGLPGPRPPAPAPPQGRDSLSVGIAQPPAPPPWSGGNLPQLPPECPVLDRTKSIVFVVDTSITYGEWSEAGRSSTRDISEISVAYMTVDPLVQVVWTRNLWMQSKTIYDMSVKGDPGFSTMKAMEGTNGPFYIFNTTLTAHELPDINRPDLGKAGDYTLKLATQDGHFMAIQNFRIRQYSFFRVNTPQHCVDMHSYPAPTIPVSLGEPLTLTWEFSSPSRRQVRIDRVSPENDVKQNIYPDPNRGGGCFGCPYQPLPDGYRVDNYRKLSSDRTMTTVYEVNIDSIGVEDGVQFVFSVGNTGSTTQVATDLQITNTQVFHAGSGPVIQFKDCDGGRQPMDLTSTLGINEQYPNCVHCIAHGHGIQSISFSKDGNIVETSPTGALSDKVQYGDQTERSYTFLSPTASDAGSYTCTVSDEGGQQTSRDFEVIQYEKIQMSSTHRWTTSEFSMTCRATGSPLPVIEFYRYSMFMADVGAEGPLSTDGPYQVIQTTVDDRTIVYQLVIRLPADQLRRDAVYCAATNPFETFVGRAPTVNLYFMKPEQPVEVEDVGGEEQPVEVEDWGGEEQPLEDVGGEEVVNPGQALDDVSEKVEGNQAEVEPKRVDKMDETEKAEAGEGTESETPNNPMTGTGEATGTETQDSTGTVDGTESETPDSPMTGTGEATGTETQDSTGTADGTESETPDSPMTGTGEATGTEMQDSTETAEGHDEANSFESSDSDETTGSSETEETEDPPVRGKIIFVRSGTSVGNSK